MTMDLQLAILPNQESSLESKIEMHFGQEIMMVFPRYVIGEINYNYDHKKNNSGRFFFQNNGNDKDILTDSRTFI